MSTLGTFDSFSTARLGIYAAQQGLQVTGNNISNINTPGYTRQRLDQVSFKAGAYDRYRSQLDNHCGTGALVMDINQIRDPYLDVRYRNTNADVGYNETFLKGLDRIASILDEVGVGEDTNANKKGDGRLQAQIQAVSDALRRYSKEPTKLNNDLARKAADTLCGIINSYATQLETFRKETEKDFEDKVKEVNEILLNIRDLNDEIRDNEIFGDNALELRDERNRQIDKLSELIHIKVIYGEEDVGAGRKVEKLSIYLDNDNPDPSVHTDEALLVDGIFASQLSSPEKLLMANPAFDPQSVAADDIRSYRYLMQKKGANDGELVYKDKDGNEVTVAAGAAPAPGLEPVMVGTNDVKEAALVDNNNYGLQISQLEDEYGRLWEGIHTDWGNGPLEPPEAVVGQKAIYQTQIKKSDGWVDGNKFTLNGKEYTIGTDITADQMNDEGQLASFLAKELGDIYKDAYTVTASSDGTIRFTAKKVGAIGSDGPAAAPEIKLLPDTPPNADIDPAAPKEIQPGKDHVIPNDATGDNPPLNPNGTQTIIAYELNGGSWYRVTTIKEKTYPLTLDDNDLHGSLQATRELLTEKGEFASAADVAIDEDAAKKHGIPFYQSYLDLFAYQFATEYNKLNQGYCYNEDGNYIDENNQELQLAGSAISKINGLTQAQKDALIADGCVLDDGTPDIDRWLGANNARAPEGVGVLFSNRNDGDKTDDPPIRAANITVSHSWATGDVQLVPKFEVFYADEENPDGINLSTLNTNADHMVTMIDPAHNILFNPQDIKSDAISDKLFVGSFNGMYNDMCTSLGEEQKKHTVASNMYTTQLVEIDYAREGVSGVDLNDEAMNLMQYQKAYSAACRLMTVIDEALDRLINNTGIAGR